MDGSSLGRGESQGPSQGNLTAVPAKLVRAARRGHEGSVEAAWLGAE